MTWIQLGDIFINSAFIYSKIGFFRGETLLTPTDFENEVKDYEKGYYAHNTHDNLGCVVVRCWGRRLRIRNDFGGFERFCVLFLWAFVRSLCLVAISLKIRINRCNSNSDEVLRLFIIGTHIVNNIVLSQKRDSKMPHVILLRWLKQTQNALVSFKVEGATRCKKMREVKVKVEDVSIIINNGKL